MMPWIEQYVVAAAARRRHGAQDSGGVAAQYLMVLVRHLVLARYLELARHLVLVRLEVLQHGGQPRAVGAQHAAHGAVAAAVEGGSVGGTQGGGRKWRGQGGGGNKLPGARPAFDNVLHLMVHTCMMLQTCAM